MTDRPPILDGLYDFLTAARIRIDLFDWPIGYRSPRQHPFSPVSRDDLLFRDPNAALRYFTLHPSIEGVRTALARGARISEDLIEITNAISFRTNPEGDLIFNLLLEKYLETPALRNDANTSNIIHWIILNNRVEMMKRIIRLGIEIPDPTRLMIRAVRNRRLEMAMTMIECGADPSANDNELLFTAGLSQEWGIVRQLLELEPPLDITFRDNFLLREAAFAHNFEMVRYLIDERPGEKIIVTAHEGLALSAAIEAGNVEFARYLIDERPELRIHPENFHLFLAVQYAPLEMIQLLLEREDSPDISFDFDVPLRKAIRSSRGLEIIRYLVEERDGPRADVNNFNPNQAHFGLGGVDELDQEDQDQIFEDTETFNMTPLQLTEYYHLPELEEYLRAHGAVEN